MVSDLPTLSLCMIVRDEAEELRTLLPLVLPHVDEVIVVDTGSSDATMEVLQQNNITPLATEWVEDFAIARNISIEAATGDWILVLDADERLDADSLLRLRQLCAQQPSHVGGLIFDCRNYTDHSNSIQWQPLVAEDRLRWKVAGYLPTQVVRLFRNNPAFTYRGCVHELVEMSIEEAGLEISLAGVTLHHLLRNPIDRQGQDKNQRYLKLLEKKCTLEPQSAKACWELGRAYLDAGLYPKALGKLQLAWQIAPSNLEIGISLIGLYNALGSYADALAIIRKLRVTGEPEARLEYQMGVSFFGLNKENEALSAFYSSHLAGAKFPQAMYWVAMLTAQADPSQAQKLLEDLSQSHPDFWQGLLLSAQVFMNQGQQESACEKFSQAFECAWQRAEFSASLSQFVVESQKDIAFHHRLRALYSGDGPRLLAIVDALEAHKEIQLAYNWAQSCTSPAFPRSLSLRCANLAIQLKELQVAAKQLEMVEEELPGADSHYAWARLELARGDLSSAADRLGRVLKCDSEHVSALTDLAGLHGNSGRLDEACALLEHALAIEPDNGLVHHNLAVAAMLTTPPNPNNAKIHMLEAQRLGVPTDGELDQRIATALA